MDLASIDPERAANAIVICGIGVAFGIGKARKKPAPGTETFELAGAVMSDRAAALINDGLNENSRELRAKAERLGENTAAHIAHTRAVGKTPTRWPGSK